MSPYPQGPWYPGPPPLPPGVGVGVKVLAGFQCFFGAVGLLMAPLSFVQRSMARDTVSMAMYAAMWDGPAAIWFYFSVAAGILLALALLVSGIGLFMSKRWARTLGLIYGGSSLLMLIAGQLVMLLVVYPVLTPFLESHNPVERGGAIGGLVGGLFGMLFGAVLPVAMLIVLGRKSIVPQLRD